MPARQHRITRGDDYRRIVRSGKRVGGDFCLTHAVIYSPEVRQTPESAPARFGFIVSKSVGNAVTRNLVRRRLKSIVERRLAVGIDGIDVVFRALPASATADFNDLEHEVLRSLDRVLRAPEKSRSKRTRTKRTRTRSPGTVAQ